MLAETGQDLQELVNQKEKIINETSNKPIFKNTVNEQALVQVKQLFLPWTINNMIAKLTQK